MTTGQRAAACAISLIAEGKRKNGRWVRGSVPGDEADTSRSGSTDWPKRMAEAGTIADWSDEHSDLLIAVRDGVVALDAALARLLEGLRVLALHPEYHDYVSSHPPRPTVARWERRST